MQINDSPRPRNLDDPKGIALLERYRPLVDDWEAFIDAMRRKLPACVWANPIRTTPGALAELMEGEGIAAEPLAWRYGTFRLAHGQAGSKWWYLAGLAHSQEEASMVPVTLLDPRPGERVLDMCAAPGGKTAQIAVALGNQGTVIANDRSTERLRALKGNLERLGIINVSMTRHDAVNYPRDGGQFDKILLDAPCSGEGTLRKNPKLIGRVGPEYSRQFANIQRLLLRKAVQRCRPGGRIVYSTCTFAPEENEAVVNAMLAEFGGKVRLLPAQIPGLKTVPGITEWAGEQFAPEVANCLRIWPHHNDTGGFFVAVIEKSTEGAAEPMAAGELKLSEADGQAIEEVRQEFGFQPWLWERFRFHRQSSRGISLVAADHRPPRKPVPESVGMFFYKTQSKPAKLSTAAAMLLGPHAMLNRVYLDDAQRDAYLNRKIIDLSPEQVFAATAGLVIVYYRGYALGIGVYHERSMQMASLFPKRWSGRINLD